MNLNGRVNLQLASLNPSFLLFGYFIYKYVLSLINRPAIEKERIVFQEWVASGSSMKNILTRLGGGNNCVRLVVTDQILWVTAWFPFSLLAPGYDMEHVIPLNQISEIETREGWFSQQIILSYVDENGTVHRLKLIPKKREVFLEALKLRPGFEKYPHSPWN